MGMLFLLSLAAVSQVAAQCNCYADSKKGFWQTNFSTSLNCDQCLDGYTGADCRLEKEYCEASVTCFNHGLCSVDNTCTCDPGFEGDNCDQCVDPDEAYPLCGTGTLKCDAENDCNSGGTCPKFSQCGSVQCNSDQKCCRYRHPTEAEITIEGCISKYQTCCGADFTLLGGPPPAPIVVLPGPIVACAWNEKCADQRTHTCIPSQRTWCPPQTDSGATDYLRMEWQGVAAAECLPKQTCCKGTCCQSNHECLEEPEPREGWVNALGPLGYKRWYCADQILIAPSAIRIAVLPALLTLVSLLAVACVVKTAGIQPLAITIVALLVVFMSIFVLYSHFWMYALMAIVTALFAIGAPAGSSKWKWHYSLALQLSTLLVYIGGAGLGSWFTAASSHRAAPHDAGGAMGWSSLPLATCINHYGYFTGPPAAYRRWDQDPNITQEHYCSRDWVTAVLFFQTAVMVLLVVLIVRTGISAVSNPLQ